MHTAEIPLVMAGLTNLPWGNGTCNLTETEHALSAAMTASWTAMAATGNPSTDNTTDARTRYCLGVEQGTVPTTKGSNDNPNGQTSSASLLVYRVV